jgi:hypothetical protein
MKLLFDENLSHKLVWRLADLFPESVHVRDVGLKDADDVQVWEYAQANELVIVSRIRTCISVVSCWVIRLKSSGYDWVIAQRRMLKICCVEVSLRSKHSTQTLTPHF